MDNRFQCDWESEKIDHSFSTKKLNERFKSVLVQPYSMLRDFMRQGKN